MGTRKKRWRVVLVMIGREKEKEKSSGWEGKRKFGGGRVWEERSRVGETTTPSQRRR